MTYEELSALQYGRSKSFSEAQTEAMAVYCQAEHDLKQLQQENAKLRELVRMAWKCAHSGLSCSDCRMVAGGCTLQSAMRELGVDA